MHQIRLRLALKPQNLRGIFRMGVQSCPTAVSHNVPTAYSDISAATFWHTTNIQDGPKIGTCLYAF